MTTRVLGPRDTTNLKWPIRDHKLCDSIGHFDRFLYFEDHLTSSGYAKADIYKVNTVF